MIMECEAIPVAMYGKEVWEMKGNDSRVRSHLSDAEKKFLLMAAICYRTVSMDTLRVLCGTSHSSWRLLQLIFPVLLLVGINHNEPEFRHGTILSKCLRRLLFLRGT